MGTSLYLDTARMGQMAPRAQRANLAFTHLAGKEGCSTRFEDFLHQGLDAWPDRLRKCYKGLADWRGLAGLKASLRSLTGAPAQSTVLLANRSSQLMRLSARLLFRRCRRVLVTDLEWPAYRTILNQERERTGRELQQVPLRAAILQDRCSQQEVVARIAARYDAQRCDGLFLTAVTYEGLRLPVRDIVRALTDAVRPSFVVVDGAQALCHTPAELSLDYCDLYIAGCHKWLRAYHPMGVGLSARPSSQGFIRTVCAELIADGHLDDPLLHFTNQGELTRREAFSETVSLIPLFPCAAAVAEALGTAPSPEERFQDLLGTSRQMEDAVETPVWTRLLPHPTLRSGILLLQPRREALRKLGGEPLRRSFQSQGVAVTAYDSGIVRLSVPPRPWRPEDGQLLRDTLHQLA